MSRRPIQRTSPYRVKNAAQLKKESLNNSHNRSERFLEVINTVTCLAILTAPLTFAVMFGIYMYHIVKIGDWNQFYSLMAGGGGAIIGYLVSVLRKKGITKE